LRSTWAIFSVGGFAVLHAAKAIVAKAAKQHSREGLLDASIQGVVRKVGLTCSISPIDASQGSTGSQINYIN
jgi:hypothetical protein